MTINSICTKYNQPWMESGVSENAVSGHIQLMLPGRTACFQCCPPLAVASHMDERQIQRNGVCTASLPTTMSIIAGFLAHNTLKYLLHFGQLAYFQGYQSQTNYFPSYMIRPSVDCVNEDCQHWRSVYADWQPEQNSEATHSQKKNDLNVCDEFKNWDISYPFLTLFILILFILITF